MADVIHGDDKWHQIALLINQAMIDTLTSAGSPLPDRAGVVPGAIAWDDCTCGILATSWSMTYLTESFPQEATTVAGNCTAPEETSEFVIQLIRCAPGASSNGSSPSVTDLTAAALLMATDGNIMERAASVLLCALKDNSRIWDYMISRRTAQGPSGLCVGNELRVLVGLPRG
jgi:hypothetical protein